MARTLTTPTRMSSDSTRRTTKNTGRPEFYVSGVGTRHKAIGKVLGGVFGLGELTRIEEGYKQLCREWIATKRQGRHRHRRLQPGRGNGARLLSLPARPRHSGSGHRPPGCRRARDPVSRAVGRRRGVRPRQPREPGPEFRPPPRSAARKPEVLLPRDGARRAPAVVPADAPAGRLRSLVPGRALGYRWRQWEPRAERSLDALDDAQGHGRRPADRPGRPGGAAAAGGPAPPGQTSCR